MRVGVATIRRGRREHLMRQAVGVDHQTSRPVRYVAVTMDADADADADAGAARDPAPPSPDGTAPSPAAGPAPPRSTGPMPLPLPMPVPDGTPLPLSRARNAAIEALGDVDLAVLLDVDCIPGPDLVRRYAEAAVRRPDGLLAGPVGHLPPGRPTGPRLTATDRAAAEVRGGRPVPAPGELLDEPRATLFWSLSFALRPSVHRRIGGFDEGYVGYGGEDTDYALRADAAGVPLSWVGGACAYHQHHPVSSPPREHLASIVRNARRFRHRWGTWPMEGWLRAFAAEGLVVWDPAGDVLDLAHRRAS